LKEKMTFELDMKTASLTEAQSSTYLADLLLRTHRYDDAEPFLKTALALDPNSSFTNTTMGMVKLRQRKFDEAKSYLEKAVSQDAKNAYAFYNYAYLLSREGRDELGYVQRYSESHLQKMRDALNKSIALNPAYIASYELLAFINMVNNQQLAESVELLRTALKYQPGEPGVVLRIAEIWSRMEKYDDAKALAKRMAEASDDDDVKRRADSLISEVESRVNLKAQNEARRKEFEDRQRERAANDFGRTSTSGPPAIRKRQPEITRTPEELAKIAEMQKWIAINQAINKPKDGEKQILGRITKITCPPKQVIYSVKTETGVVSLMSKDFQSLTLVAFDNDAQNAAVGCNRGFAEYNAVLTYKESVAKSAHLGELLSIDFVPADFKFVKEEDLAALETAPVTTIPEIEEIPRVEPPPRPASGEVRAIQPPVDREAERRKMIFDSIRERLNKPEAGEVRVTGTFERAECDKNTMYFHVKTPTGILKLKPVNELKFRVYVPDLSGLQLECNDRSIPEPIVVIYKPTTDKKPKFAGDLISIEFVPMGFTLE
jgi:type IV pilus assembly protein PilF